MLVQDTGFFYGNSAPVGSNATLFRNQTAIGTQLVTDATKLSTTSIVTGKQIGRAHV